MEKLWTTAEVAQFLGVNDADVEKLVKDGRLTGYKLGGKFMRFRPDQVTALKPKIAPSPPLRAAGVLRRHSSWRSRLRETVYFYDFYFFSGALLLGVLVYLIVAG